MEKRRSEQWHYYWLQSFWHWASDLFIYSIDNRKDFLFRCCLVLTLLLYFFNENARRDTHYIDTSLRDNLSKPLNTVRKANEFCTAQTIHTYSNTEKKRNLLTATKSQIITFNTSTIDIRSHKRRYIIIYILYKYI